MRATRRLARGIAAGVALAFCANATGDDQVKCGQVVDAQLNEMWSLMSQAGSVTYKKLMDRAIECVRSGKCGKPESLVFVAEMMVDERVVTLQQKKRTSLFRDFFARAKESNKDLCALSRVLPSVFEQLNKINALQYDRFNEMMAEYLASPSGESR